MIHSAQTQNISYEGTSLRSSQRVYWSVTSATSHGETVSETHFFETGLLERSDYQAKWIEPESEVDPERFKPSSYLRKKFQVREGLSRARAYLTAHGLYSFYINGMGIRSILDFFLHRLSYRFWQRTII